MAETYDVIVEPIEDHAYTIFAETMDRSGYARGTLAPRAGMEAAIPQRRPRPLRTMEDMGMAGMKNPHGDMAMPDMKSSGDIQKRKPSDDSSSVEHGQHDPGILPRQGLHEVSGMNAGDHGRSKIPGAEPVKHGPDNHGPGNQMVAEYSQNRMGEPGRGLENSDRRVLRYTDLKSLVPYPDQREPEREIEIHLTGNMNR